ISLGTDRRWAALLCNGDCGVTAPWTGYRIVKPRGYRFAFVAALAFAFCLDPVASYAQSGGGGSGGGGGSSAGGAGGGGANTGAGSGAVGGSRGSSPGISTPGPTTRSPATTAPSARLPSPQTSPGNVQVPPTLSPRVTGR